MNNEYLTVTQINKYIKYKFENDSNLNLVYLKGEISNFKNHSSGHLYFTLKDENSRIMAVMFRNNAMKIKFNPIIVKLKNAKEVKIRSAEISDAENLLKTIKKYIVDSEFIPKLFDEIKLTIQQEEDWINSFIQKENSSKGLEVYTVPILSWPVYLTLEMN